MILMIFVHVLVYLLGVYVRITSVVCMSIDAHDIGQGRAMIPTDVPVGKAACDVPTRNEDSSGSKPKPSTQ